MSLKANIHDNLESNKNLFTSPSPFYMMRRDANPKFVRLNSFLYVSGVLFKSVCFNFCVLDLPLSS